MAVSEDQLSASVLALTNHITDHWWRSVTRRKMMLIHPKMLLQPQFHFYWSA